MLGLFAGLTPTVVRAMAVNVGQLAVAEECKERYNKLLPNNLGFAWFLTVLTAGFTSAAFSLPFDNAKTKMQKMKAGPDG